MRPLKGDAGSPAPGVGPQAGALAPATWARAADERIWLRGSHGRQLRRRAKGVLLPRECRAYPNRLRTGPCSLVAQALGTTQVTCLASR